MNLTDELYRAASESPELDRIVSDMDRHSRAGKYDRNRIAQAIQRFVVEPSAIALAEGRAPWFTVFPKETRAEVTERILGEYE